MRLVITDHACLRYAERVSRTADPEAAIRLAMRTAVRLAKPARDGCAFWRAASFVMICLDGEGERVVRTVIGLDALEREPSARWERKRAVPPKPFRHPRR